MAEIISLLLAFSAKIGYLGVVLLMTVESSFIPFPSEIVIPPAAYLASRGEFNIYLVILSGLIGSLFGALINYFLARTLGRMIVYKLAGTRLARILLVSERKIKKSEDLFLRYGAVSTFIGRLVPAVRQLISIPAGFCRMPLSRFILFTALGSGLWTVILAVLGYVFGANQEAWMSIYYNFKHLIYGFIGFVIVIVAVFWIRAIAKNRK